MKKTFLKALSRLLLFIYAVSSLFTANFSPLGDSNSAIKCYTGIDYEEAISIKDAESDTKVGSRFLELFFGKNEKKEEIKLS